MVDAVYRSDSRRVLATLIRLLGDFDLAEEALQDAFAAAVEGWPRDGVPANPRAWLVSAGRFKAIDTVRRRARFDASLEKVADELDHTTAAPTLDDEGVEDDRLRLIFTCCHPALPPDAQIALTSRKVSAICASGGRAGWQQVKINSNRSSSTTPHGTRRVSKTIVCR